MTPPLATALAAAGDETGSPGTSDAPVDTLGTAGAESSAAATGWDLSDPALYLNRELTWLSFNYRVLHEAEDPRTPLLERVKFVAIVSSNLDEFYMKRIGGLKQQLEAGVHGLSVDGRTPAEQLAACHEVTRDLERRRQRIWRDLQPLLEAQQIRVLPYPSLDEAQKARLRDYFTDNIFPLCTPLAMDPGHPFPFISNLALNFLVTVRFPGDQDHYLARVKVPTVDRVAPRFLPVDDDHTFVALEQVMVENLDLLFPGMEIVSAELFRVTRNAQVERDEEQADDLLEMIELELRDRHFADMVRLEVAHGMNSVHRGMIAAELGLHQVDDVLEVDGMLAMRDLFQIASLDISELHEPDLYATDHPRLQDRRSIFYTIRDGGPILLQHPYESFATSVERFLGSAARDPKVLAIKMTLYRTSSDSAVVGYLIEAARAGKQVAVLMELKARFDEAANIQWAQRMEQEGIHVTYGVVGLKTHSKVILVVRRDFDRLRRYAHVGTGNYHSGTAKLYTDFGMLSCDDELGKDLSELFNYLTGYTPPQNYRKILAAPYTLKVGLLKKIDREIKAHSVSSPGLIQFKMNALEDVDLTRALYRASQAGVRVDLIVRDTCRLRPGIPGLSENIRVISIVGRFLEHGRIYYFRNGGDDEYFIGSADAMKRNLESRVEVVAPVEAPALRDELRSVIDIQLGDPRSAWEMQADGSYRQRRPPPDKDLPGCQQLLIASATKRAAGTVMRKRKRFRSRLMNRLNFRQ